MAAFPGVLPSRALTLAAGSASYRVPSTTPAPTVGGSASPRGTPARQRAGPFFHLPYLLLTKILWSLLLALAVMPRVGAAAEGEPWVARVVGTQGSGLVVRTGPAPAFPGLLAAPRGAGLAGGA